MRVEEMDEKKERVDGVVIQPVYDDIDDLAGGVCAAARAHLDTPRTNQGAEAVEALSESKTLSDIHPAHEGCGSVANAL